LIYRIMPQAWAKSYSRMTMGYRSISFSISSSSLFRF
jgi:hypothetical protein